MKRIIIYSLLCLLISSSLWGQRMVNKAPGLNTGTNMGERLTNAIQNDFSRMSICLEERRNPTLPPKAINFAPAPLPRVKSNGELEVVSVSRQALVGETNKMWSPGDIIFVGFITSKPEDVSKIDKVQKICKEWEQFANISFSFTEDPRTANVKVGFDRSGHWSWVGREVLGNNFGQKTMNLDWEAFNNNDEEARAVILHEFGHVLGFIHEHQSPVSGIQWDKEKVYSFLGAAPNFWDRRKVDANVFYMYTQTSTNFSQYDKQSIMHYFFPPQLTLDNFSMEKNFFLSSTDKQFARQVYPFAPSPSNASGILRTGDDCDEIDFSIEYNAVNKNLIEFVLVPGIDKRGNNVNWWKQIGIPLKGNGTATLEMQDGRSETRLLQAVLLDNTRGISFAKAKILGVHTGLGYQWKVMPAIIGGCRIKLTWRNDHCY